MKTKNISNLIEDLLTVEKPDYEYTDIVNLSNCLNRHFHLGDIDQAVGDYVEIIIRFWNYQDEQDKIPVEKRTPIKIFINSGGGDLVATFTMIDAIRMSKTPVWTINTGAAYSGGFFTFLAGHKRIAYEHSTFLYHEGSTFTGGDAGKFRNYADFYKRELEKLKDLVLKYTKITEELYEKKINDDWWLMADEAVEYGICDEICKELIL